LKIHCKVSFVINKCKYKFRFDVNNRNIFCNIYILRYINSIFLSIEKLITTLKLKKNLTFHIITHNLSLRKYNKRPNNDIMIYVDDVKK